MNFRKQLSRIISVSVSAALTLSAAGCGSSSGENKGSITFVCLSNSSDYWNSVRKGAADGAEEMMYNITFSVPDDESPESQASLIQEAVGKKPDALIIAPSDPDLLSDEISAADKAGIPVIIVGSEVSCGGIRSYIGPRNETAGEIAGRRAADISGENGKFAVIGGSVSDTGDRERAAGFIRFLDSDERASYTFVSTQYCEDSADKAKELTLSLLEKEPDLTTLLGTDEASSEGICEAIAEKGLTGKMTVIGFGSSARETSFVRDGTLAGLLLQNPYNIGYLSVRNCMKLLGGQTIPSSIDSGFTYVDKENIDEDYVQLLLDPEM